MIQIHVCFFFATKTFPLLYVKVSVVLLQQHHPFCSKRVDDFPTKNDYTNKKELSNIMF